MTLEITVAQAEHLSEISKIAYEGFRDVASRHGFPPDFASPESAEPVYDLLIRRSDYFGIVALVDGKPVGSNFIMKSDELGAIGPLSVSPSVQGHGIGRLLMTSIMGHAANYRIQRLRLLADSYNVPALSLYSSLGFEVRDSAAIVLTNPAPFVDTSIRPMIDLDLPTIDRLSRKYYHDSRCNEVMVAAGYGFPTYLKEREGRITGYIVPGLAGHCIAETEEDALALIGDTARSISSPFRKFLCPMRQSKLLQSSLKAGWRIEKILEYMTCGPYEYPTGVCTPSACY